jgi:hypothetical protein
MGVGNKQTPKGLAKKPGKMPPGQYKKLQPKTVQSTMKKLPVAVLEPWPKVIADPLVKKIGPVPDNLEKWPTIVSPPKKVGDLPAKKVGPVAPELAPSVQPAKKPIGPAKSLTPVTGKKVPPGQAKKLTPVTAKKMAPGQAKKVR